MSKQMSTHRHIDSYIIVMILALRFCQQKKTIQNTINESLIAQMYSALQNLLQGQSITLHFAHARYISKDKPISLLFFHG